MPFRLSLYRAAEGLGPLGTWEAEHRVPLGTREELKKALEHVFGPIAWATSDTMLWASSPFGSDAHACEVWLFGEAGETLYDVDVYSAPPAVRAIMSGLGLNYCYAQESGQLYLPFEATDDWPVGAH